MRTPPTAAPRLASLLVIWFAFVNQQLLFGVLCFVLWKINNPQGTVLQAVYWDAAALDRPLGAALLGFTVFSTFLAWWLPPRLVRPPAAGGPATGALRLTPEEAKAVARPYLVRLVLLEAPSIFALVWSLSLQNPLLALPFLALGAAQTLPCLPSESNLGRLLGKNLP